VIVAPSRHPLVASAAWLLPLSVVMAIGGVVAAHAVTGRLLAGWFALLACVAWLWQRRQRPVLLVDDAGWAIEQRGREKLRVAWSEVQSVRFDRKESAFYADCGDVGRNLFVPPRRGFGFRFGQQEQLCERLLASVPADRVHDVERLDRAALGGGSPGTH
jgi:hypothetical protein